MGSLFMMHSAVGGVWALMVIQVQEARTNKDKNPEKTDNFEIATKWAFAMGDVSVRR